MICILEDDDERVERAVEKLRSIFMKRGVVPSVGGMMVVLAAEQGMRAPAAMAATVSAGVSTGGTGASAAMAQAAPPTMATTPVKLGTVLFLVLAVAGGLGLAVVGRAKPQPRMLPVAPTSQTALSAAITEQSLSDKLSEFVTNQERLAAVLQRLSDAGKIQFESKWEDLAISGITPDTPISFGVRGVRFRKVIALVLESASTAAKITDPSKQAAFELLDDGRILITSQQKMYTEYASVRRYPISDLLNPPNLVSEDRATREAQLMPEIAKLVQDVVDSVSWTADRCGPIRVDGTDLVVTQIDENHRAIAALLRELREQNRVRN
jgi:hypothetical protein